MSEFVNYIREHERAMKLSFDALDHNKDGYIDVDELIKHLKKIGIQVTKKEALELIQRFFRIVSFIQLTLNSKIKFFSGFLKNSYCDISISNNIMFYYRMDKDNSLTINWAEWRDFLVLYPSSELSNIYKFWRHSLV